MTSPPPHQPARRTLTWAFLLAALLLPTVVSWLYFVALAGSGERSTFQQVAYAIGKVVQFSLPVVFVAFIERRWPRWPDRPLAGLLTGLAFSLLVVLGMLALYHGWLQRTPMFREVPGRVLAKVREMGVDTPLRFWALGVFYAVLHSAMEEYYWRWFVFGRLSQQLLPLWPAIVLSALGFTAHHVIILGVYMQGHWLRGALPLSVGITLGGAFWAWLYHRSGSLAGPWLGHLLIDAAIFIIGWDMLQRASALPG